MDAHHDGDGEAGAGALTPETMSLLITALPPFALAAELDKSGELAEMAHR